MSARVGLALFCAGVVCGMALEAAASVQMIAHPDGMWNHLRPDVLSKWGRETTERASAERAHRRIAEMDVET